MYVSLRDGKFIVFYDVMRDTRHDHLTKIATYYWKSKGAIPWDMKERPCHGIEEVIMLEVLEYDECNEILKEIYTLILCLIISVILATLPYYPVLLIGRNIYADLLSSFCPVKHVRSLPICNRVYSIKHSKEAHEALEELVDTSIFLRSSPKIYEYPSLMIDEEDLTISDTDIKILEEHTGVSLDMSRRILKSSNRYDILGRDIISVRLLCNKYSLVLCSSEVHNHKQKEQNTIMCIVKVVIDTIPSIITEGESLVYRDDVVATAIGGELVSERWKSVPGNLMMKETRKFYSSRMCRYYFHHWHIPIRVTPSILIRLMNGLLKQVGVM